jgi:two-component system, OmpR family, alkaline phosphatase synthesis response regulator PhoP
MNRKARILLVDDDADFVTATKKILESKSWEVIVASNGEDGIKKAKSESPDLILLDMMMPVKDGFLAAKDLKTDAKVSKIPVLALTSFNQNLGDPFEIQVDEYIQKTITPVQLLEKVQGHLKKLGF